MNYPFSFKRIPVWVFVLLFLSGVLISSRSQAAAIFEQTGGEEFTFFLPIVLRPGGEEPAEGEFVFHALSDANIVIPAGPGLEAFLATQKIFLCQLNDPIATNPLTYAQAKDNVWMYLNERVGENNLATFRALPEAATAETAQAFAVAAIADRPDGALTSLMVAAEKAPAELMILVSTAGLLNLLEMPNEALAFLNQAAAMPGEMASPLGISGIQIAANNRGHALMLLGRWAEAEDVLRVVVEAEPQLSEARTNLSIALLCQNKDEEAGYFYRLGARRHLYDAVKDGPEIGGHLPTDMIYDRSAGETLALPGIPLAPTAEQTGSLIQVYDQMSTYHLDRYGQYASERDAAMDEIIARQPTLPFLTNFRYANVIGAINAARQEPYIVELAETWAEADEALVILDNEQAIELDELFNSGLSPDHLYPACRSMLMSHWGSRKLALQAYEDTRREYAAALYYEQTGLAANLVDPLHHKAASLIAKIEAESAYGDMVGQFAVHNTDIAALW